MSTWSKAVFVRPPVAEDNLDHAGLPPSALRIHSCIDGVRNLDAVAREVGLALDDVAMLARGLELAGLIERRSLTTSILVAESDPQTVKIIQDALAAEPLRYEVTVALDQVGFQGLLRRGRFDIVFMDLDGPEQEKFYGWARGQASARSRFVGIVWARPEIDLDYLDMIGLEGVIERPVTGSAVVATVTHLVKAAESPQTDDVVILDSA